MKLPASLFLMTALALGAPAVAAPAKPSQVSVGRAIAVHKCSGCHAVGLTNASPNPNAPPFRNLYKRYPIDGLREAFLKGYRVAHPPMPKFLLPQAKVDPLLAFLKSLDPCSAPSSDQASMKRCFEPL